MCDTRYLCWYYVVLKAVRSFKSNVPSTFPNSRGGADGSGGKSITLASIRKYVGVLHVRFILQT